MKVQSHSSLESPIEYNQELTPWKNQAVYYLFSQLNWQLFLEGIAGKEIPESSR